MTEREKVIDYLEYHIHLLYDVIPHVSRDDGEYLEATAKTMSDAIILLKKQEPRIVTEADFENADEAGFIPAWCEEKDAGEVYCECISIGALEDAKFGRVRWWTFRPTDAQRKAVKWDG